MRRSANLQLIDVSDCVFLMPTLTKKANDDRYRIYMCAQMPQSYNSYEWMLERGEVELFTPYKFRERPYQLAPYDVICIPTRRIRSGCLIVVGL